MAHPLLSDAFVNELVADAAAPFDGRLPPEEAAWLKDQLAVLLQDDAELAAMLKGAHPRAGVDPNCIDSSGERGPLGIDDARLEAVEGD